MKIRIIESIVKKAEYPSVKIYIEKKLNSYWKINYVYIGIIWLNRNYLIIITNE